ncbi:hypothetical protein D3C87_2124940 [compost metagenome]
MDNGRKILDTVGSNIDLLQLRYPLVKAFTECEAHDGGIVEINIIIINRIVHAFKNSDDRDGLSTYRQCLTG